MDGGQDESTRASIAQLADAALAVVRLLARSEGARLPFAHAILAFPYGTTPDEVRAELWNLASLGIIELVLDTDQRVVSEVRLTPLGISAAAQRDGKELS
jgi:hypothetical protein